MKLYYSTLQIFSFLFLITSSCFSQNQDYEKKVYYELSTRARFFEVDQRYQLQSDTIFYANAGFLVDPEWDEITIGNDIYIVLTYPKFSDDDDGAAVAPGGGAAAAPGGGGAAAPGGGAAVAPGGGGAAAPGGGAAVAPGGGAAVAPLPPVIYPIADRVGNTILAIKREDFEKIVKQPLYSLNVLRVRNYKITSGQLNVPFKLRPKIGNNNFQMTTDVTIGAYGGITKRISRRSATYLTIPAVLGLSFININENTTSTSITPGSSGPETGIVPGFTWSSGLILQLNKFDIGFVVGKDYASGVGNEWLYHKKIWYSFAIGYSFLK